jgi:hypothetical protein
MSLKYESSSEPLHISAKQLFISHGRVAAGMGGQAAVEKQVLNHIALHLSYFACNAFHISLILLFISFFFCSFITLELSDTQVYEP